MVIIDQLRIAEDGKMFVDAHINTLDYFKDDSIESITIVTSDKVSETSPEVPVEDSIYYEEFPENPREIHLILDSIDFQKSWEEEPANQLFHKEDMSKNLFFVYIKCRGKHTGIDLPCSLDRDITVGVTFDDLFLYNKAMSFTKSIGNTCNIPIGFIDFILLWNAFKVSIYTEHYIQAIQFFNMLFGNIYSNNKEFVSTCGCRG